MSQVRVHGYLLKQRCSGLGGGIISMGSVESSSVAKGETLADTARTVSQYADVIVIRHPRTGSAKEAADAVPIPVINAGDGTGQHPTQALLDIYTIKKEVGSLKNLAVAMVGDLKNGRTVHALAEILSLFGARLYLVSPDSLRMPEEITSHLKAKGIGIVETGDMMQGGCGKRSRLHDPSSEGKVFRPVRIRKSQRQLHHQ